MVRERCAHTAIFWSGGLKRRHVYGAIEKFVAQAWELEPRAARTTAQPVF